MPISRGTDLSRRGSGRVGHLDRDEPRGPHMRALVRGKSPSTGSGPGDARRRPLRSLLSTFKPSGGLRAGYEGGPLRGTGPHSRPAAAPSIQNPGRTWPKFLISRRLEVSPTRPPLVVNSAPKRALPPPVGDQRGLTPKFHGKLPARALTGDAYSRPRFVG